MPRSTEIHDSNTSGACETASLATRPPTSARGASIHAWTRKPHPIYLSLSGFGSCTCLRYTAAAFYCLYLDVVSLNDASRLSATFSHPSSTCGTVSLAGSQAGASSVSMHMLLMLPGVLSEESSDCPENPVSPREIIHVFVVSRMRSGLDCFARNDLVCMIQPSPSSLHSK